MPTMLWSRPGACYGLSAALLVVFLAGCGNPLKPRIDAEKRKLADVKTQFDKTRKDVEDNLKKEPELFRAANVTAAWRDRFQTGQEKLNDAYTDLEKLNHRDNHMSLFADVDRLRDSAINDATSIQTEANRWLDLKRNTAAHLDRMKANYEAIKSADTARTVSALEKAEEDWPAKKADLEGRVESLKSAPAKADKMWAEAQEAAKKSDYAALMNDEQWLDSRAKRPEKDLKLVAELYNSKDVILEKLDKANDGDLTCGAKVKVISTHLTDIEDHQSKSDTKQLSEQYPLSKCDSLQNDVGMEIEHKPAGAFDSEAQRVPQPPGFAYMAPPGQRNQYGYWETHNGSSVWTWLPEYLILREMLWGPRYIPVPSYEYEGYWSARRAGTTYYGPTYSTPGTSTPAPPKYGTHGTFTANRYNGSRFQNQGGTYRSSGYSNGNRTATAPPPDASGHQFGRAPNSSSQGKRFGGSPSRSTPRSAPSGRRFGRR